MKHSVKVTFLILGMFLITQLIGLFVASVYAPRTFQAVSENGELVNITTYNLPFGLNPPSEINTGASLISIIIAIFMAVIIMFLLMKIKAEFILRIWFFFVVTLALSISLNALLPFQKSTAIIAIAIALPLAVMKIFKRNILIHNFTELLIYPGIAAIFIPILSLWTAVILLILISIYDIYAVWHAGFMQKMAKYQINKVKVFSGFFIPYIKRKDRELIANARKNLKLKPNSKSKSALKTLGKKIKVNVALLGGGDVVFPLILAGVVLFDPKGGLIPALFISAGATLGLAYLLYKSEKGKFYPAMPFITAGCLIGLALAYLFNLII